MNKQKIFSFKFKNKFNQANFYVNKTNIRAYEGILNSKNKNILLIGPNKSGKTFLSKIWQDKFNAIKFDNNNFEYIIDNYRNVVIDNLNTNYSEESLFHILNHCKLNDLKSLIISNCEINEISFKLNDLISRLKSMIYLKINHPDDDMLINLLTKFFIEKQFIVNSNNVFEFIIKNIDRTYENILDIVEKLDNLSIEKKRQLTIPLIKEIL